MYSKIVNDDFDEINDNSNYSSDSDDDGDLIK